MRSVVVEIKNDFAAVLSDDGRILKVKNKDYTLGQVIVMKKEKFSITKKVALLVASLAVVVLAGSIGVKAYTTPYSYVSMDVNPSIEYTLNRFDRVIDVNAVNDDGQEILDVIDVDSLYHMNIEDAIIKTVDQISAEGYLNQAENTSGSTVVVASGSTIELATESAIEVTTNSAIEVTTGTAIEVTTGAAIEVTTGSEIIIEGGIVITVSGGDDKITEKLVKAIEEVINEHVDENVVVEVYSVGYERVQEAKRLGVTPGKLNLVEKLQASAADPNSIILEEWIKKPVKDIMIATKENRKAKISETDEDIIEVTTGETKEVVTSGSAIQLTTGSSIDIEFEEAQEKAEKAQERAEEKAEKAEEKAEKAQEKAQEKADKAEEKAEKAQEKAQEKAEKAQEKAEEKAEEAQKKAEEKAEEAQKKAEEKAGKAGEKDFNQGKNGDKQNTPQNNSSNRNKRN